MKHLFLIRHAKSSWADEQLSDRERPLNPRGQSQLAPLGNALAREGAFDGLVRASDATRAMSTLEGIVPPDIPAERIATMADLYTFDWHRLVRWLESQTQGDRIALVGHNPALLELASWLLKHPPAHLPTAAFIHIKLPIDHWRQVARHKGKLERFLTPADYSYAHFARKLKKQGKDTELPAALQHQLSLLRQLEAGVIQGLDSEFLHQYRIAIRRSRAMAEAFQDVSGNRLLSPSIPQLKRHAQATSHLRDLHVLLSDLPALCHDDEPLQQSLHHYFSAEAAKEQKRLSRRLSGKRYEKSVAVWEDLIHSRKLHKLSKHLGAFEIRTAVEEKIRDFNRRTAELMHHSPDNDIHRLRKQLKRLRYLMELDQAAWKPALKEIKSRQELYGQFQDLCVQIRLIDDYRSHAPRAFDKAASHITDLLKDEKAALRTRILALGSLP